MEERKLKAKKEEIINVLLPYDEHKGKTFNSLNSKTKPVLLGLLKQEDYDNLKLLEKSTSNKGKGARQIHGFIYEDKIIQEYALAKNTEYIGKWDTLEKNSIKIMKYGSDICLSDFFRQRQIDHDFIIYIGFWKGQKTNVIEEYKILIKKENWSRYFGNYIDEISLKKEMDGISFSKQDNKKWLDYNEKYKKLYDDDNSIIKLRFKRDQEDPSNPKKRLVKRLQCAINFSSFRDIIIKENRVLIQTKH